MTINVRRTGATDYGQYVKMLIVGPPGVGKTILSSTAPNVFFASAEAGLMSVADRNVPFTEIKSTEDLLTVKNLLDQPPAVREELLGFPVDTVVIDTIDEIQRILIQERLQREKRESLALQDWGWLGENMQAIIRGFRNILSANVVFTCHTKESQDSETGKLYFKPGLQGAIADQIAGMVDLALLLRAGTIVDMTGDKPEHRTVRVLQTYPDTQHPWIKDRSGKLPSEVEVTFEDDFKRLQELIYADFGALTDTGEGQEFERVQAGQESRQASPAAPRRPPVKNQPSLLTTKPDALEEPAQDAKPSNDQTFAQEVSSGSAAQEPSVQPKVLKCEECGGPIENEDQYTLSYIKLRKHTCRSCMVEAGKRK